MDQALLDEGLDSLMPANARMWSQAISHSRAMLLRVLDKLANVRVIITTIVLLLVKCSFYVYTDVHLSVFTTILYALWDLFDFFNACIYYVSSQSFIMILMFMLQLPNINLYMLGYGQGGTMALDAALSFHTRITAVVMVCSHVFLDPSTCMRMRIHHDLWAYLMWCSFYSLVAGIIYFLNELLLL